MLSRNRIQKVYERVWPITLAMTRERAIRNEWTTDEIDEMLDQMKPITLPVNITVRGKQKVLDHSEARTILEKARLISLENCMCRLKLKNCDAPVDLCICIDEEAEIAISDRGAWKTTLGNAMDALRRGQEAGLVQIAYEVEGRKIQAICSCCACCCHSLAAITRFGYDIDVVEKSGMIAVHDKETCENCELCISRCHFDAWGLVGGEVHLYSMRCAGCGVCVASCPTGSIKLVERNAAMSKKPARKPVTVSKRPMDKRPSRK